MRRRSRAALLIAAVATAWGQSPYGRPLPVRNVGIDQKLNAPVPLDLTFADENGVPVQMKQFFTGKPVLLSLVYYQCPMLCNMVLNGEAQAMRRIGLEAGKDYEAVTVSFDPKEKPELARSKKATYSEKLGIASGWHFLTGDAQNIRALADAVGFRYQWDDRTKQWGHASGIMVLTPEARVSRYLFGIEYQKRDLRLALVDASQHKIGTAADRLLLLCYHYDPSQGKYTLAVVNSLRVAGGATLVLLGAFVVISLRKERRDRGLA
jgi:protein SCO1/2